MGRLSHRRVSLPIAALLVAVILVTGLWFVNHDDSVPADGTPGIEETFEQHPRGGSVRVGVSTPPEMVDGSVGGDTLRQLVYPSMFVAQPDGTWRASLVQPGSDRTAGDATSAQFVLRSGAKWTDGSLISVDDLRRTQDPRFVSAIEGPDAQGVITVRFTQALPGWRRLWSGDSPIRPVDPNAYGGPFRVESVTSGLETVVVRNDSWWGAERGPLIDEIRLVLTSDSVVEQELLAAGLLDVVAPAADTVRTERLRALAGVKVSRTDRTNAFTLIRFNPERVNAERRKAIASTLPRSAFIESLLAGEATVVTGLENENTWPNEAAFTGGGGDGWEIGFVLSTQQPVSRLLGRSLERAAEKIGAKGKARVSDDAEVARLRVSGDYDVLMETVNDGPEYCWVCHFDVDSALTTKADGGDRDAMRSLQQKAHDDMTIFPLWRPAFVAGFREAAVRGVDANGYSTGIAWNADQWWRP